MVNSAVCAIAAFKLAIYENPALTSTQLVLNLIWVFENHHEVFEAVAGGVKP